MFCISLGHVPTARTTQSTPVLPTTGHVLTAPTAPPPHQLCLYNRYYDDLRKAAAEILVGKKERKAATINRNFMGDYIGYQDNPSLRTLVGKKERVVFAFTANKYDRRFKVQKRDLLLSDKAVYIIGREVEKKGPKKGTVNEVIKRRLEMTSITGE